MLVARLDSMGDVLLTGPAVRAIAREDSVTMLVGPSGRAAAELLPGVQEVITFTAPWIVLDPPAVDRAEMDALVSRLADGAFDRLLVFGSFHQSPLPLALLGRLAGIPWIGAHCEDYPGSLLDLRHRAPDEDVPEAERAMSLVRAAGYEFGGSALSVRRPLPDTSHLTGPESYVVVHPGAAVAARRPGPDHSRAIVSALVAEGHRVVVTGAAEEARLAAHVADEDAANLAGRVDLAELADVLDRADVVVAPNTGPAHLAAAVGTPVVSLFAPVVSSVRWAPHGVPRVVLGDQTAACRGTRARRCPVPGHPCLDGIDPGDVVEAVHRFTTRRTAVPAPDPTPIPTPGGGR